MKQKLIQILADTLGLAPAEIPADASMEQLSAWDSIAHLNVVMTVEQEFGVQFQAEEFMSLNSLPAIEQALASRGVV
ncbi:MAG: acyl carrier protein [Verrucomicrobiota bacterium]